MQIVTPFDSGISNMILLTNTRNIQPQIQPQTVTRLHGEQLVISFPKGWRQKKDNIKMTVSSPTDETKAGVAGFRGFKTLSAFENWCLSLLNFQYKQLGVALVHIPYRQVGIGRRFSVNKLDIVIREYEDASKLKYLGLACVRLQDVSVSVVFTTMWNAITEKRKIFENGVMSVRIISKNLL